MPVLEVLKSIKHQFLSKKPIKSQNTRDKRPNNHIVSSTQNNISYNVRYCQKSTKKRALSDYFSLTMPLNQIILFGFFQ